MLTDSRFVPAKMMLFLWSFMSNEEPSYFFSIGDLIYGKLSPVRMDSSTATFPLINKRSHEITGSSFVFSFLMNFSIRTGGNKKPNGKTSQISQRNWFHYDFELSVAWSCFDGWITTTSPG